MSGAYDRAMIDPYNAFSHRADDVGTCPDGPLSGLSIGVKANIAVKGMPHHAGLAAWIGRIAAQDATTVAALRAAGAMIAGTLHMEEGALGAKTDNPHFGPVQNPHRAGYSPGGSSGGSGAAVAAGLVDAALGTDTMGSVRIPASHCGVYGFKPATDRVSQDGLEAADLSLDAIGPLARDLDTLERVARVMSRFGEGGIAGDGASVTKHGVAVHPEVASVFDRTAAALATSLAQVSLSHEQSRIRFAGFIGVSRAMSAHLQGVPMSDHLAKLLTYGPRRADSDWAEDQRILSQTADEVCRAIDVYGFMIMPTVPNPPFSHSDPEPAAQADFTCLANIAGLPALSIPAGWTADGLPIGVQIIGQSGAEAGLFALARQLDDKLSAYRAPPKSEGA